MPVLTVTKPAEPIAPQVGPMTTWQLAAHVLEFLTGENWCRGCFAENKHGQPTDYDSEDAVRWCVMGAARYIGGYRLAYQLCLDVGAPALTIINDHHGLQAVRGALQKFMENKEKEL